MALLPPASAAPLPTPHRRLAPVSAVACLALLMLPAARADDAAEVRSLLLRGDFVSALQRAERAAAANPRDAQARFLNGVVLMEMQRDDDALALFTRLSQEYPELPDPYNNIALLHSRHGRLEDARQALQTALRNDPTHRTARANLGQVHLMLAVQAWEEAARGGAIDVALQRRLEAARALLGTPASAAATAASAGAAGPAAAGR